MSLVNENLVILQKLSPHRGYPQASTKDQAFNLTRPPPKLPNKQFLQILLPLRSAIPLEEASAFHRGPLDLKKSFLEID